MKVVKLFLYAAMLLTICEVTGISFLARQDKAFCNAVGEFETPTEEDETRDELEDTDDFFFDSHFSLPLLTATSKIFGLTAQIMFTQPLTEIVVPPPQA